MTVGLKKLVTLITCTGRLSIFGFCGPAKGVQRQTRLAIFQSNTYQFLRFSPPMVSNIKPDRSAFFEIRAAGNFYFRFLPHLIFLSFEETLK